jgi:DNA-directed RNA polymerase subunit beta
MPKTTSSKNKEIGSLYDIKGRHYFTDDRSIAPIPSLLEVQLDSYKEFLEKGIDDVFKDSFPISDFS